MFTHHWSRVAMLAVAICFGWLAPLAAWDKHPAPIVPAVSNAATRPMGVGVEQDTADRDDAKTGRYSVRSTDQGTILLDTTSGQTWMLMPHQGKLAWLPVERIDPLGKLRELGAKISVKDGIVREVDLTNSTITDKELELLSAQTSLEHLILNGCSQVTDAGLVHLQGLTKLTGLALERTNITDAGLANLNGLTQLNYLSLNWTQTGDAGLEHLAELTELGVLYLCQTETGDTGLVALKKMDKLQWLDLRGTRVTDAGLTHLSHLPQLRLLSLHGIRMTDAGVAPLTELSQLEVLTLSQTQITDAGLSLMTKLPKLTELDVGGTQVTQDGMTRLQQTLPNCRVRFQTEPQEIID